MPTSAAPQRKRSDEFMNSQRPQPYAYIYLALIVVGALFLLWLIFKIIRGLMGPLLSLAVIALAIYGGYTLLTKRT